MPLSARLVALALAVLALAAVLPSSAFAARSFDQRFGANDTGDITLAANTLMSCPGSCAERDAAANPSSNSKYNNNDWNMVRVDADGDTATTLNSSTATLNLPAGAKVLFAGLYWGAKTDAGNNGLSAVASKRGEAKLKVPGGRYAAVTASNVDDNPSDSAYHAFADVTSRVAAAGEGVYAVGDVQAATGEDRYAGWALVVAYHDDDAPTRNLTIFDGYQPISGTASVGPTSADITVNGFQTPPAPAQVSTRVGAVSYEGDLGLFGDSMQLNGHVLANAVNPANNFFNSTIADGTTQTTAGRSPSQLNHFGFDADLLAAPAGSMGNSASQATLRVATASSGGETFYPGVLTFATDLYAPKLRPVTTVTDLNGGKVEPGDVLRYKTTGTNVGTDTAAKVTVTQDVPAAFELLADTLQITDGTAAGPQTPAAGDDRATWDSASRTLTWRLGTGDASVLSTGGAIGVNEAFTFTYDVRVGAPANGSSAGGPASSEYVGQSMGYPFKLTGTGGSVSVAGPDLAMDLTRTGELVRGETATYSLSVKNVGAAPTLGPVQVVDELPAGVELDGDLDGAGWTCDADGQRVTCNRSDVLAIDDSYPSITIPVRVRQDGSVANAATVSGGSDGVDANNSDGDAAIGLSKSALSLAMPSAEGSIAPSDTTTLTATVTNDGPSDAAGVAVDFTPPAGLELVSASTGGVACLPAACAIGTIPARQAASVSIVVRATRAAHGSTQELGASVTAASQDTTSGDDAATAHVVVRDLRPVSVTQSVTPSTLVAGKTARLVYDVANSGPSTASGVVLRVPLPAALRNVQFTSGATCAVTLGELTCTLPDIHDGEHANVTVDATVAPDAAGRPLTLRGTIDRVADDPDASDDTDATTRAVTAIADLSLSATDTPDTVVAGTQAKWTFRAANAGPSDAPGAELHLPLPAGTTFVRATGATCVPADSVLVCKLDTLDSGATRDVAITLAVAHDARAGTLALDATVRSDADDPDAADATAHASTTVKRSIALEVEQSHGTAPIVAGTPAAFTSQIGNAGPSDASDVVLTQRIPEALTGATVELRSATGTCTIADSVARCTIPALAVGERAVLVLAGHVPSSATGAQLFPTTNAKGAEPDTDPADNEATDPATAIAVNDLAVSAKAPTTMIITGREATVQLLAANNGPSDATEVIITQELPAAAEIVELDPRCTVQARTVTCRIGNLTVGESAPIELKIRARRPFDGRLLSANVSVRGAASDPSSENDSLAPAADIAAACASVRDFPIRLRVPHGLTPKHVSVRVDGHRVHVFRRAGRLIARVNLRGSTKARVSVRIDARTRSGRRITGVRTYHPCTVRRPSPHPPKV